MSLKTVDAPCQQMIGHSDAEAENHRIFLSQDGHCSMTSNLLTDWKASVISAEVQLGGNLVSESTY